MVRGGAYVNKGTYGCVFNPAVRCNDNREFPGSVGKVYFRAVDAGTEKRIAEILESIDPNQKTMIYPKDVSCRVLKADVEAQSRACLAGRRYLDDSQGSSSSRSPDVDDGDLHQMIMKYGGLTLTNHLRFMPNKMDRKSVLQMLTPIFKAIKKLTVHGLVHQDIKLDNIVVSLDDGKARLIDFGAMKDVASRDSSLQLFHTNNYWFDVKYFAVGPEYRAWQKSSVAHEKQLLSHFPARAWIADGVDVFDSDYVQGLTRLMDDFKTGDQAAGFKAMRASNFHTKIDLYSLGVVILGFHSVLIPAERDDTQTVASFNDLLYSLLRPHPNDRPSVDTVLRKVQQITCVDLQTPVIRNRSPKIPVLPDTPECPPGKVRNPQTKRCVNRNGKVGRLIVTGRQPSPKPCPPGKIRNPQTGRCIKEKEKEKAKAK